MVALILLLATSCLFGSAILRGIPDFSPPWWYRWTLAILTGMGCWCIVLFLSGIAGMATPPFYLVVSVLPVIICGWFLYRQHVRKSHVSNPAGRRRKFDRSVFTGMSVSFTMVELLLCATIAFFLIVTFICCFAPVYGGIANDEIHTHLSIPAAWLRSGSIAPPAYPVSYMSGNGELLFMFTEAFSRGTGAHLVSWFAFVISIFLVYALARNMMNRTPSLIAAVIVTINPLLFRSSCVAFVDSLSMAFMLGAIVCAVRWYHGAAHFRELILGCALAGIGCGIKPTNIVYTALYGVFISLDLLKQPYLQHRLRKIAITAAVITFTASPWPVRTLLLTGSPTFPPPPAWFASGLPKLIRQGKIPYTDKEVQVFYRYVRSRFSGYHVSTHRFLALPWEVTMHPGRFQIGDSIGTVLLSLLPFALIIALRRKNTFPKIVLTYISLSSCGIYFLILPEARYFSIAYCLCAPLLTFPFTLAPSYRIIRLACSVIMIVNILFSLVTLFRIKTESLKMLFSRSYRTVYISTHTPYYETFTFLSAAENRHRNLVVLYDSPIWYYLNRKYTVDNTVLHTPGNMGGSLLLDIDYSQIGERIPERKNDDFIIEGQPPGLKLIFDGGDARVFASASE